MLDWEAKRGNYGDSLLNGNYGDSLLNALIMPSEDWIEKLTAMTDRELKAKKRGRKRKQKKVNGWN